MENKNKKESNIPIRQVVVPQSEDTNVLSALQTMQLKNEVAEVLKELFNEDKILMMTDLSPDEIKLVVRIRMIADMKKIKYWDKGLELFMKLVLSRDRKSRKEILEAIRGYSQSEGFLSKLNPANWKGR